jgi:hypothetical protein
MTTPTTTLEFANLYRSMGFVVIPMEYGTKKPIVEWSKYMTTPPTNEEYAEWFGNGVERNIGAICGAPSNNLLCLDFEKPDLCDKFFDKKNIRDATFCSKTARGEHVYLRTDRPIKTHAIPGVMDILGEKHLVCLPPSKHPSGVFYQSIGQQSIIEIKADDFERIFWDKAEKLGYYQKPSIVTSHGTITTPSAELKDYIPPCIHKLFAGVSEGGRNKAGFVIASYLKNVGKNSEELRSLLNAWNSRNQPPIPFEELREIQESVEANNYGVGCTTDLLAQNCTATKPGDCRFRDPVVLLKEITEKVEKIKPHVRGDVYKYIITISGKEIEISSDKTLSPTFFRQRWVEEMGNLIPISNKQWEQIFNYWNTKVELREEDTLSTETVILDKILEKLSECNATYNKELALAQEDTFYIEQGTEDALIYPIYISSNGIQNIIESTHLKVDIRRINVILRPYLLQSTKVLRVGNKVARFWVFPSTFLDMDWKSRIIENKEKDETSR